MRALRGRLKLQWGRGGEAAERMMKEGVLKGMEKLQWGRGGEAAERVVLPALVANHAAASMGPRR